MALFGFGRKKEEPSACGCGGDCGPGKAEQQAPVCACGGPADTASAAAETAKTGTGLVSVKVLGSGCRSCRALLDSTNEALRAMSVPFEAEYVTDMAAIAACGVLSTPALVVNGKVVSMGRVYSAAEVEKLLHKLGY